MSAVRARMKPAASAPRDPYAVWWLAVALAGAVLVGLALWHHLDRRAAAVRQARLARGLELLNKLTPAACDYFYADKKGPLPPEVWADFRNLEKDPEFVDAWLTASVGAEDHLVDEARYKDGKTADGRTIRYSISTRGLAYYGPPGSGADPSRAQVQVAEGSMDFGDRVFPVLYFRRPILRNATDTAAEHGKAWIILRSDVRSPRPEPEAAPEPPAAPPGGEKQG